MDLTLKTPVQYVPRVGPSYASKLETLGIKTVEDLLLYPPFRYNDYSLISPIARVQPGETVTIEGTVEQMRGIFSKKGKRFQQATVTDESGSLTVVWFNQPFLTKIILEGNRISLSGKVDWFGTKVVLLSPDYELINTLEGESQHLHTGRLVPVYPETEGVTSKWLRGRISYVFDLIKPLLEDPLPQILRDAYHVVDFKTALSGIHFPKTKEEAEAGRLRLSFDEFFFLQLTASVKRKLWETTESTHQMHIPAEDIHGFIDSLPFPLTSDQKRAVDEILQDFTRAFPANRLLEGDVGAGKTIVATIAIYTAFRNGLRSVIMAPTEILAKQHFETITKFLSPLGIKIQLVTGSTNAQRKPAKKTQQKLIKDVSTTDVYVGTHALLSSSISFDTVGLVVIDEQQRFGVEQRLLLRNKTEGKKTPHLLTMTATPIPRTIALTLYGNLDLSLLQEMPKGRAVIKTWVVPTEKRLAGYEWIKKQIRETGGQVFIICPLVEESESLSTVKAAKSEFEHLRNDIFQNLRLGLLHGRMKPTEKDEVLNSFRNHTIDILVATPVVEVGIDIPNATIMCIEAADRFGLSALHQLRGRVGRGSLQSYCLLFTENQESHSLERLKALETVHNGPELAEIDLKLRGPGQLFGTRQHGLPRLRYAAFSNIHLIRKTREAADALIKDDPDLVSVPLLRTKLKSITIESTGQD